MARPKSDLETHKVNFHGGDWEKLRDMFPNDGPTVGARTIVRAFCKRYWKPTAASMEDVNLDDIE